MNFKVFLSCDSAAYPAAGAENFGGRGEKMDSGLYMNEYCDNMYTWRSILVRSPGSEEGPKNPLKGISMKSLVFACYAQFRVDAGG